MADEEKKVVGQEGILVYEKETGKQAMVDGKLTDDFKAWALKRSKKLEDVSKETKEETKAREKAEKKLAEEKEEKEKKEAKEKEEKEKAEKKAEDKKLADEKAKEDAENKKGKEVYVVKNNLGQFIREYTPEIHGDKRKELAKEFAKKIKGKVIIK